MPSVPPPVSRLPESTPDVAADVVEAIGDHRWQDLWEPSSTTRLLNHGSFGRPFKAVRELQCSLRTEIDADPGEFYREGHNQMIRGAADDVATLLDVGADKAVAFRHNASTAIVDAVGNMARRDDVVVITNLGYGGIQIGLTHLANMIGFRLITIEFDGLDDVLHLHERIRDAVRAHRPTVLVLDEITSDTALHLPITELATTIREISPNTRVVVDGAHSAGMLSSPSIDAVDVWVSNLHKWPCASPGTAVIVAQSAADIGPLQRSWSGDLPYPDSYTWTGTDDYSVYLTSPLALRILDRMKTAGLDAHIDEVLDKASSALAAEWEVPADARLETMRAPWMRLVELPVPGPYTHDWAAAAMTAARNSLDLDVAVTFFGERAFVRLSAHGYNTAADYERVAELPAILHHV